VAVVASASLRTDASAILPGSASAGLRASVDGAVALPFAPGPVVDADKSRGYRRSSPRPLDASQQRIGAGRHGGLCRQPRPGFTTQGRADGEVSSGAACGRTGMLLRESIERLDEDAARASRSGTEESADSHLETNLVPEGRFLGEAAGVAAVNRPTFMAADRTGCVRVRRRDPESQGDAIEISPGQATADGSAQKLGEKQGMSPREMKAVNQPGGRQPALRSWVI